MKELKIQSLEKKCQNLQNNYNNIVIPDRRLDTLKKKIGDISQNGLKIMIDYLNRDKYLVVQAIAKTINKDNILEVNSYLDGAISRIEGLIITLSQHLKPENKVANKNITKK